VWVHLVHDCIVLPTSPYPTLTYLPIDSISEINTEELLLTILLLYVHKVLQVPHESLQLLKLGGSIVIHRSILLLLIEQVGPYRQKELVIKRAITNVSPGLGGTRDYSQDPGDLLRPGRFVISRIISRTRIISRHVQEIHRTEPVPGAGNLAVFENITPKNGHPDIGLH